MQELRRSNAAGVHGVNAYTRKEKHKTDWLAKAYEDYPDDNEEELW